MDLQNDFGLFTLLQTATPQNVQMQIQMVAELTSNVYLIFFLAGHFGLC